MLVGVENMSGRRRIGRVGDLVVDGCSASSRGLGRSMGVEEDAARSESVYARKRRPSPIARARAQEGTYCFHNVFFLYIRSLVRSWLGIVVGVMG